LEGFECLAYARGFLGAFDGGELLRVKASTHDRAVSYREPGFWGYCYPPTETLPGYRISVFACGEDHHFPRGTALWRLGREPGFRLGAPGTHAGILEPEYVVEGLGEGLLWILGHEIFHYLAATEQVPLPDDERHADLVAYELLWAFREAVGPADVAGGLRGAPERRAAAEVLRLAPKRWPYAPEGRR
jgi:hypothetical protein